MWYPLSILYCNIYKEKEHFVSAVSYLYHVTVPIWSNVPHLSLSKTVQRDNDEELSRHNLFQSGVHIKSPINPECLTLQQRLPQNNDNIYMFEVKREELES